MENKIKQVKVFGSLHLDSLEAQINDWLDGELYEEGYEIIDMKFSATTNRDSDKSYAVIILYK
jgi:hypothetical protein